MRYFFCRAISVVAKFHFLLNFFLHFRTSRTYIFAMHHVSRYRGLININTEGCSFGAVLRDWTSRVIAARESTTTSYLARDRSLTWIPDKGILRTNEYDNIFISDDTIEFPMPFQLPSWRASEIRMKRKTTRECRAELRYVVFFFFYIKKSDELKRILGDSAYEIGNQLSRIEFLLVSHRSPVHIYYHLYILLMHLSTKFRYELKRRLNVYGRVTVLRREEQIHRAKLKVSSLFEQAVLTYFHVLIIPRR